MHFVKIGLLSLKIIDSLPENIWQVVQKPKASRRMISMLGSFFMTPRYVAAYVSPLHLEGLIWYLKTPLQDNGCDCGAFVCAKMLSVSCHLPDFTQQDIPNVRRHIALQLHRGAVHVPEYNIPTRPNPIVDSPAPDAPSASLTQEDVDAVQTLLSLATPERAVRFDHEVQVQEFRRTVRSVSVPVIELACLIMTLTQSIRYSRWQSLL